MMEMRAAKFGSPSSSKPQTQVNRPEALHVVQALLTKALNPDDADDIKSPELMMQADSFINAAKDSQHTKKKLKTAKRDNSPTSKSNKRKEVSPVNVNEQTDNKRLTKDKHKLTTLRGYFSKNKPQNTETSSEPP